MRMANDKNLSMIILVRIKSYFIDKSNHCVSFGFSCANVKVRDPFVQTLCIEKVDAI